MFTYKELGAFLYLHHLQNDAYSITYPHLDNSFHILCHLQMDEAAGVR